MCGYSVHRQCDFPEEIGGNRHYLIRLQSHGECGARLNDGEQFTLCKGDLLTLAPGDKLKLRKDKLQMTLLMSAEIITSSAAGNG